MAKLTMVQGEYPTFLPFLEDVMHELGFSTSDIQADIAGWLQYGPQYLMVMAQRGQAKSTITAAFCVWSLIHAPHYRILIVTAESKLAKEISNLVIRLILNMAVLECLRPDRSAGDLAGVEAFDVHHTLKGINKSPSVKCAGVTGGITGSRADILIADDVESPKNSATAEQREKLLEITKEFSAVCANGRIIWLGTPQSRDSIYTTLKSRGVAIRIWTGRYPAVPAEGEEKDEYDGNLAPLIQRRMDADPSLRTGGGIEGNLGRPVDPVIMDEAALQKKENGQLAYFMLQYMLSTKMSDALRYPLHTNKITVLPDSPVYPVAIVRGLTNQTILERSVGATKFRLRLPHAISDETVAPTLRITYIDPAGGGANADETAVVTVSAVSNYIVCSSVHGIQGGYDVARLTALAEHIVKQNPDIVVIEQNFGYGAFRAVFEPILSKVWKGNQQGLQRRFGALVSPIMDDMVTGSKERRIIATLEPVIGNGQLVFTEEAVEEDKATAMAHATPAVFSVFHQLSYMQDAKGALSHDDRVDALEGACRFVQSVLGQNPDAIIAKADIAKARQAYLEQMEFAKSHGYRRQSTNQIQRIKGIR